MTDLQIERANEIRRSIDCMKDMLRIFETPDITLIRAKKKILVRGYSATYHCEHDVDSYKMDRLSLSVWKQANIDFLNTRIAQLQLELAEL